MEYSAKEEVANAVTHGIGALLSIAALVILIIQAALYGNVWHVVSVAIFGASLVILYTCSTLLHSLRGKAKDVFEILDHSAIYLLIAGTYTPFLLVTLRGPLGWSLFGIVWGLALVGIVFKAYFVKKFILLSTLFYIGMGWMIIVAFPVLLRLLPTGGILWLVIGGVLYTVGSLFYVWRGIPYHHAIWHSFVIAGSVSHFFAVLLYVIH
jgi:hemolysin III